MKKYCPRWVFNCVISQICFDYIEAGAGLNIISKKYYDGLKNLYDDKQLPKLDNAALNTLKICSSMKINEKSTELISEYLYFNFYFVNRLLKRKFKTIFNDATYSKYPRYPDGEDAEKKFFLYANQWRLKPNKKHKKGWNLKLQNEFLDLKNLAKKPFSDEVNKLLIEKRKTDEFISTWTKN